MTRLTNRRTVLLAAGTAAAAAAAGKVAAQSSDIQGVVTFEGEAPIPQGNLKISLGGAEAARLAGSAGQGLTSNGKSTRIAFSLSLPDGTRNMTSTEIVAELLRDGDDWLLARGSAQIEAVKPVHITLYKAMY